MKGMSGAMHNRIKEVPNTIVDLTSPGYNAMLGRYFIGQTGELNFGDEYDAWGGLINPINSKVNLFFDIFTITNYSNEIFTAKIVLNGKIPRYSRLSSTVTPSNQAIVPPPKPTAFIKYSDYMSEPNTQGINIFDRIVTSNSTLVSDSHKGSIMIGPGGSFSIHLLSPGHQMITGTIVLTWWEDRIYPYSHNE